jgi:polysaccharide deacetylase 2 family uncharacterized protein YibQ
LADDLGSPLGKNPAKRSWQIPAPALAVAAGMLGLLVVAFVWVGIVNNPRGGEPFVVVGIENSEKQKQASPSPPAVSEQKPSTDAKPDDPTKPPPGSQTVTIIDGKSGARQEVVIRNVDPSIPAIPANAEAVGSLSAVDPRLVETSRHGPIPRMASDGTRPLDAYASAGAQAADRKIARIAIVVGGLGIGGATTSEAIAKLPSSITLAFAPYGNELSRWAARARGTGHEIVLQLPMEPFDYPDNDPGPQTLLSTLQSDQNLDRLYWMLSRIQGYVGVTNYMGARFTASENAFSPVLQDISKRGLLYLDDGSSPRSITAQSADAVKATFLKADLVIDTSPNWADIDTALAKLEMLAADRGFAIGTATALPVSIERIARWAKAAEARGIRIVPLSAILPKAKQS